MGRRPLAVFLWEGAGDMHRGVGAAVALWATVAWAAAAKDYWRESDLALVEAAADLPDFAALARAMNGSVVSITATAAQRDFAVDGGEEAREFFERFYGTEEPPTKGMASGFIIREDGYVLTNAHVVEGAAALNVTLGVDDDRAFPARVVGRDEMSDLALIKIDVDEPLQALRLGDSDTIGVGDWVAAIGNPFGLSHTMTVGVVSFIGRRDINPSGRPGYYDFIQTDASINPGNSGGPLLDRQGRVVGINAAVNATGQGIGFAIPINMAKDVLPSLYEKGRMERSFLGVAIQDLSPELARSFGVEAGVVVTEVTAEGPAAKAGLRIGDVLTSFENEPVGGSARLRWLVSTTGVGRRVALGYVRKGAAKTASIALAPLPGQKEAFSPPPAPAPKTELAPLGFALGKRVQGPYGQGFRVEAVDMLSHAYVAGLREGDLVLQVGDAEVKAADELQSLVRPGVVRLYIQRGLRPMFVAFEWSAAPRVRDVGQANGVK